jgi:uracil phosphoribosyltransferase
MEGSFVVGLYGVSGSGKSHGLSMLSAKHREWRCLEGSEVIARMMQERGGGTLEDFQHLDADAKESIRSLAAGYIRSLKGVTLVAGHFSFPMMTENGQEFDDVFTEEDAKTYDVIFYLDTPPERVYNQRQSHDGRAREELPIDVLEKWILHEKDSLPSHMKSCTIVEKWEELDEFITQSITPLVGAAETLSRAALRGAIEQVPVADVYLLIDGDHTITPQDTGRLFFDHANLHHDPSLNKESLNGIFKRFSTYEFQPFYEASLLYMNALSVEAYKEIAHEIGSNQVFFHDSWLALLSSLPPHVHPILVSSSIRESWKAALDKYGLSGSMTIIAGNHAELHDYLVDPEAKEIVVTELRRLHRGCRVIAVGDSSKFQTFDVIRLLIRLLVLTKRTSCLPALDVPMLKPSDQGYIVFDLPRRSSDTMNRFMVEAAASDALSRKLYQIALEPCDCHRAYFDGLKVGSLTELLQSFHQRGLLHFSDEPFARILATSSRNSECHGPQLQAVHVRIGRYLASKLMNVTPSLVEERQFRHVTGHHFKGLASVGAKLTVMALMRGGEPMARGVYESFPESQFIHYVNSDLGDLRLIDSKQIIIVDSVINSGNSIREVLHELCGRGSTAVQVYVVTVVIQDEAARRLPEEFPRVRFIALRVSENKYTGKGATDTGNRLFSTW